MSLRKKLGTKFKNARRTVDSERLSEEKEKRGIPIRPQDEGMYNFLPKLKKPRIEVNVLTAQLSSRLKKAQSDEETKGILMEYFALRRQLVAAPKMRLTIDQLTSLFAKWCSEKAASFP